MPKRIRNNGLTIVMMALFAFSYVGMAITGFEKYNEDQSEHHQPTVSVSRYLESGAFWEATFENWESEFLQMGLFVVLTAMLVQKGSSESKKPDGDNPQDAEGDPNKPGAPGPVRQGGFARKLYENSLSIALLALFFLSAAGHGISGAKEHNEEQKVHGQPPIPIVRFFATPTFWFQSFQNWQSEFLSIAVLGVLTIYLRQKGSPQSKPVDAAHDETGE